MGIESTLFTGVSEITVPEVPLVITKSESLGQTVYVTSSPVGFTNSNAPAVRILTSDPNYSSSLPISVGDTFVSLTTVLNGVSETWSVTDVPWVSVTPTSGTVLFALDVDSSSFTSESGTAWPATNTRITSTSILFERNPASISEVIAPNGDILWSSGPPVMTVSYNGGAAFTPASSPALQTWFLGNTAGNRLESGIDFSSASSVGIDSTDFAVLAIGGGFSEVLSPTIVDFLNELPVGETVPDGSSTVPTGNLLTQPINILLRSSATIFIEVTFSQLIVANVSARPIAVFGGTSASNIVTLATIGTLTFDSPTLSEDDYVNGSGTYDRFLPISLTASWVQT